jgi:hypothetical protein
VPEVKITLLIEYGASPPVLVLTNQRLPPSKTAVQPVSPEIESPFLHRPGTRPSDQFDELLQSSPPDPPSLRRQRDTLSDASSADNPKTMNTTENDHTAVIVILSSRII